MNTPGTLHHSIMSTASRRIAALAAAALALCVGTATADTPDWSRYSNHFSVAFTGYSGAPLKDFPALVRLSTSLNNFDYSKCGSNGSDLRFSDADGNLIPCEVDTWDASGTSLVWVKVPNLTRLTVVYGHYGCATPDAMNPNDVWDEDYVGVWHLGESSLPLKESSGVSTPFNEATGAYNTDPSSHFATLGVIGSGFTLGGSASSSLYADDDPDLTGFQNLTLEFWVRQDATYTSGTVNLLGKAGDWNRDYSYRGYVTKDNPTTLQMYFGDNGTSGSLSYPGWSFSALNTWYYYAFSYNHATASRLIMQNRTPFTTTVSATLSGPVYDSNAKFAIGSVISGHIPFRGQIDELRLSKTARSEEWLKATYDTANNASFATYGAGNDWRKYAKKFSITFPGAPSGTLTDFPVLVRVAANSPEGFSYNDCLRGSGADLRFCDADGNLLASEVDTWNTSGTSLIWVKVPTLTSSTKITAYYGWDKAPGVDGTKVWDKNYVGVWHLGENVLPLNESSGVSTPFSRSSGSGLVYNAAGKIGGAFNMGGAAGGSAVYAADDPDLSGFQNLTLEFWVRQDALNNGYMSLLGKAGGSSSDYSFRSYVGTNTKKLEMLFGYNGTSGTLTYSGWEFPALNTWCYYAFAYDHATHTRTIRKNGNTDVSTTAQTFDGPLYDSNAEITLGGFAGGTPFKGQIDELRFSKVARSEAWMKATYDTVNTAGFATYSKTRANDMAFMMIFR